MNTTSIGRQAEQKAAEHLAKKYNYKLLTQNWRTRTCEIDLIMQEESKSGTIIHFIEVKYRKNSLSGGGLASLSSSKLQRMYQASEEWLQHNQGCKNHQINIAAIELTGKHFAITEFIESISYDPT